MSRKWERMVEKNRNSVNKIRKKQGQAAISGGVSDPVTVIKGRSWMLPSVLVIFAVVYFVSFYNVIPHDFSFWFTGLSYLGLGIVMFWLRRPLIKVSRNYMTVRRYTGDKILEPKDLKLLVFHRNHLVIELADKNKKLIYTKLQHQFPMEQLNGKLREFAIHNKVAYKDEA